ncbi:hypothetical protein HYT55_05285 [Candidatus Woesearchaeota archaeon]|nr:hypothetical protein [Candidatus Woesearchaeota archaeon]
MKDEDLEFDEETTEEHKGEEEVDSSEDGFMQGYLDEEEAQECVECGAAVREEKKAVREVDGETYVFCSDNCANEFEESMS